MKKIFIISLISLGIILLSGTIMLVSSNPGSWANSDFDKCKNITITSVGDLTDFPVYINLTKDDDMLSNYHDLRFYNSSCKNGGSLLNYEIENYTGTKADIWVKTSLSSGSNIISVYYDNNTAISSGENPTGTWNDNYVLVLHMDDNTTSSILDSTSYDNDGTKVGANEPIEIDGLVGYAQDFDGNNDFTNHGNDAEIIPGGNDFTIEAWVKTTITNDHQYVIWHGDNGAGGDWYAFRISLTTGIVRAVIDDGSASSSGDGVLVTDGTWHYVVVTYDMDGNMQIWDNGVPVGTPTNIAGVGDVNCQRDFCLGQVCGSSSYGLYEMNGIIDEVRQSNTLRSADWINQSYQMMANPGTYVVEGSEETGIDITPPTYSNNQTNSTIAGTNILHSLKWEDDSELSGYIFQFCNGTWNGTDCPVVVGDWADSDFDKCQNITVTNGNDALTDFPVYINLTKDDDMLSNYHDLRFYSSGCNSGGSLLNYEIENYTETKADIWVKTNLSSGSNVISVYYKNNTVVSSGENPTGVWDDNFKMVQHLKDITTSTIEDSTSNDNDGTKASANNPVEADGKIGEAQYFDGSNDWVFLTGLTSTSQNYTFEFWAKSTITGIKAYVFDTSTGRMIIGFPSDTSDHIGFYTGGWQHLDDAPNDGEWHHLIFVLNASGSIGTYYKDGVEIASGSYTGTNIGGGVALGAVYVGASSKWIGTLDEFRLSETLRSADWINQSYQLVENQGTYVTFGSEESITIGSGWVNDTWVSMTGATNWSNVSKLITSSVGSTIAWCVYANDTSNNWNSSSCVNPFIYNTTSAECNPVLNENWIISDTQVCDAVQVTTGTGDINILSGGTLTLINGANVSTTKINLLTTGDQIFINQGCELRM